MGDDFFVWDGRNHNTIGPYSKSNAEILVRSLNRLDYERTLPVLAFMKGAKDPIGPFHVKSEDERNRLRSRGLTRGICR